MIQHLALPGVAANVHVIQLLHFWVIVGGSDCRSRRQVKEAGRGGDQMKD